MTTSQRVFRRQIRRLILIPLAIAVVIAGVLEIQVRRLASAQDWVDHTDVVMAHARQLLRSIIDQETGLRGYLLTHDEQFLQPNRAAAASMNTLFDQIRSSVADNPAQLQRLANIRQSYEEWRAYAEDAVARAHRHDAALGSVEFNLAGKKMMDGVRQRQQEFVEAEEDLKAIRAQRSTGANRALQWTLLGLGIVFALTLVYETRSNVRAVDAEYADVLTNLRRSAAELNESRERLQVTLSSIGDGVIVTDHEGKVTFLNPVAETLTQHTNQVAAGKPLAEVFRILHEETRITAESPFSKVMRLGTIVGLANHTVLLRPDGSEIAIDDSGAPIRNEEGKILGVVLVFRDVTEQKEIMNVLRTNEKLAAAGKLSASIAHEIHNPLETVRNLLFLMRKQMRGDIGELTTMAEQELSRVVQITKSMLSLYRESKQIMPVSLGEVVESVVVLLQRPIRDKQVSLSKRILTDSRISAFPVEMRQVLSNLLVNAVDAVKPGGEVEVTVEDVVLKDSREGVVVAVRDNGSGIAEADRAKLFHPFFTTKGENGTGLGLWITQNIVTKHGGYIEVISGAPNGADGTTFRVFFPKLGADASRNAMSQPS
jgi:PAS domain S-box-containing protein